MWKRERGGEKVRAWESGCVDPPTRVMYWRQIWLIHRELSRKTTSTLWNNFKIWTVLYTNYFICSLVWTTTKPVLQRKYPIFYIRYLKVFLDGSVHLRNSSSELDDASPSGILLSYTVCATQIIWCNSKMMQQKLTWESFASALAYKKNNICDLTVYFYRN